MSTHLTRRTFVAGMAGTAGAVGLGSTFLNLPTAHAAPKVTDDVLTFGDDSSPWQTIMVDGEDVQSGADGTPINVFGGFGAVSCNGTSRLLLDYKEENPDAYWRILNLLFHPVTGAGLRHIKAELGGDSNTSSGAEPATKRTAAEPADVLRGAGFHFIADALTINPDIEVEALRWAEPSWTGNDYALRYRWYKETIDAAFDTFGVRFSYLSPSQNEVNMNHLDYELAWTTYCAKQLEADATKADARYDYRTIKIVALDSYRNGEQVCDAILNSSDALTYIDAIGVHYTVGGGPNISRLNMEYGKEILYSEGVAPMIEPPYRVTGDPARGGIGGTVGAVDIVDRYINAYHWSGTDEYPAHMTTFLYQPAVSAMYEGTQYLPKSLIQASDPWSGFYEGGIGVVLVRHFTQFIEHGWEYIESACYGDGPFADGGTAVDRSTKTYLTCRRPRSSTQHPEFSQVHANNTADTRYFEVKVTRLANNKFLPLAVWETAGAAPGEPVDAHWFTKLGVVQPVRKEVIDDVRYYVYRVAVRPYSILTLSSLPEGVHGAASSYTSDQYGPTADNTTLPLPYSDDFAYAGYGSADVNGASLGYLARRSGTPRYTADQNGAFEVAASRDATRGTVLVQKINADNRGFTWNPWGSGAEDVFMTATPATVLGDHTWTNYTASVDVLLDPVVRDAGLANVVALGVRQVVIQGTDLATYSLRLYPSGDWELRKLDAAVASGHLDGFTADAWHRLSLQANETTLVASIDGVELASWADGSTSPVTTGRIALVSGIYNNEFDNLTVEPINGRSWQSRKRDDADASLTYTGNATWHQVGYATFTRTNHTLGVGGAVTVPFSGTGIDLFGATGRADVEVQLDGGTPFRLAVGSAGDRQTWFSLRKLADGDHTLRVSVVSGTLTLDGVADIIGGDSFPNPALAPIVVTGSLARAAAVIGSTPTLPGTVEAVSATGSAFQAAITWDVTAGQFSEPWSTVLVSGHLTENPDLAVQVAVEVVPADARYFVDAGSLDSRVTNNADAFATIKAAASAAGSALLNDVADAGFSSGATWGGVARGTAKSPVNSPLYDKTTDTGYYGNSTSYQLRYSFTLTAGTYMVSTGHIEWWTLGSGRSRVGASAVEYSGASGTTTAPLGTYTFPSGSRGQQAVLSGTVTLETDQMVTVTVTRSGGTEAAVVSWIGIARVE